MISMNQNTSFEKKSNNTKRNKSITVKISNYLEFRISTILNPLIRVIVNSAGLKDTIIEEISWKLK